MRVRWALWLPLWTFLALFAVVARSEAQLPDAGGSPGYNPEAMAPGQPFPNGMAPMGYQGGMPSPMQMQGGPVPGGMDPQQEYAGYDGGAGCPDGSCGAGGDGKYRGLLGDVLGLVGPYTDGGACAPRWLDISVEGMWLKRDDSGRPQALTSQGLGGPVVLNANGIDFGAKPSFKLSAWLQFKSGGNLEFNYYGQFNFSGSKQVTDPTDSLYSAFSQFGTAPPFGFLEESQARYQRIEYSSSFDNFEFNYRRHFQGAECRYAGSFLWGVRHFDLTEDFNFISVSTLNAAQMNYLVGVNNAVTGLQTGGDLWITVIPGLRAGMEGKIGVYGNHATQNSAISATSLNTPFLENRAAQGVALVTDAAFMATYRMSQQFTFKAAYNMLFVDGVALASENFNSTPPDVFFNGAGRVATVNTNGNVFYSGFSGVLEFNW